MTAPKLTRHAPHEIAQYLAELETDNKKAG